MDYENDYNLLEDVAEEQDVWEDLEDEDEDEDDADSKWRKISELGD
tara:strand:- start:314 stop:451 length:138 start_codon:yes stop_codon:yes gene_type:complete